MNVIHSAANHRSRTMAAKKLIYPAAERNKEPILSVLRQYIQRGTDQTLLEIASGSGQHIAHFAPHFPQVTFYPSDCEYRLLQSIAAHTNGYSNIKEPMNIDVITDCRTWGNGFFKENSIDYIYIANMFHIAPYECTINLFVSAGKLLKPNGLLFTYGPYACDGKITSKGNINFDKTLRKEDPEWGLRDIRDLEKLADKNNITLINTMDMPANNKTLVWKRI